MAMLFLSFLARLLALELGGTLIGAETLAPCWQGPAVYSASYLLF